MKTEQIQLYDNTYTVPAEAGGFLVTCPGCGTQLNLYDMYHGLCPWCESGVKRQRNRLIRILQALDYKIKQNDSGNVVVPDGYISVQQLHQWMDHPEELNGEMDARRLVEYKELHEGEKNLRAWCAVCLGEGYAKALQDRDPEKAKSILQGLAMAEEEKFIKFSLHKAIDRLAGSWPRQTKLLQQTKEQIGGTFCSPYILEVLQRLEV